MGRDSHEGDMGGAVLVGGDWCCCGGGGRRCGRIGGMARLRGGVLERVGGDSGEGEWEGGWLGRGKVGGRVG